MKTTDTHVYFWDGPFSNWTNAPFFDNVAQVQFYNTEQAFMYYKSFFFGDHGTLAKIIIEFSPSEVKQLGRQIKGYDDKAWQAVRYGYMVYVNYLKFSKNEDFKNVLLETKGKTLVEASPYDRVWGVGLREDDPFILDETKWQGQNLLGKALMDVRDYYL